MSPVNPETAYRLVNKSSQTTVLLIWRIILPAGKRVNPLLFAAITGSALKPGPMLIPKTTDSASENGCICGLPLRSFALLSAIKIGCRITINNVHFRQKKTHNQA